MKQSGLVCIHPVYRGALLAVGCRTSVGYLLADYCQRSKVYIVVQSHKDITDLKDCINGDVVLGVAMWRVGCTCTRLKPGYLLLIDSHSVSQNTLHL